MQKLSIFVSTTLFGYIGWYLGALTGSFMVAFAASGLLSVFGVWAGWSIHRRYLD